MAKSLPTCQTLGGVPIGRSRDHHETSSMKEGHPIFAALYDPIGLEVWPALGFNCYLWQVARDGRELNLLAVPATQPRR